MQQHKELVYLTPPSETSDERPARPLTVVEGVVALSLSKSPYTDLAG
jgi:hypothetical protein